MKKDAARLSHKDDLLRFITHFYNMLQKSIHSSRQLAQLHKIMRKQLLTTYFQPIINLQNESCLGYEILNRPPQSQWFSNTETFYEFIGHTDQVFAFERFCREISLERYRAAKQKQQGEEDVIFLNIHPQVLADVNYRSGETISLLHRYGLSPEQIVFELTEKHAVQDYVQFERILSNYRAQGFRIAIDDAGSGYNSLKAIVSLKPDFIKLDRELIRSIDAHPEQQHIVKILKQFADSSNTHIIAEGIERPEEIQYLRDEGIEFGQGYAIGKPKPILETPKLKML